MVEKRAHASFIFTCPTHIPTHPVHTHITVQYALEYGWCGGNACECSSERTAPLRTHPHFPPVYSVPWREALLICNFWQKTRKTNKLPQCAALRSPAPPVSSTKWSPGTTIDFPVIRNTKLLDVRWWSAGSLESIYFLRGWRYSRAIPSGFDSALSITAQRYTEAPSQ